MTALIEMLLGGSIFSITVVQLCTRWLRRWAGPNFAYACWLLPWLSLIAVMLPAKAASAILPLSMTLPGLLSASAIAHAEYLLDSSACRLALLGWAGAAILFFATHLAAYQAFVRNSIHQAVERGRFGTIRIFSGPNVPTPVAAGILRPHIFLPDDFDTTFSSAEQCMILRHEQAHHDRRDLIANLAGLMMLSLHWWNPLAYRAHRRFRADQELACDATAIAGLGRLERHAYGMAVLKCASRTRTGLAAAMSGRSEAAVRLAAIASDVPPARGRMLLAIVVLTLLGSTILAEGTALLAISDQPMPVVAASLFSSAQSVSASDTASVSCWTSWRLTPVRPLLARYHSADLPGVRLIVARVATSCSGGRPTRPA